ncbi:MAG: hypothetical protein ACI3VB_00310 [Oscillospiraceae bacterium]
MQTDGKLPAEICPSCVEAYVTEKALDLSVNLDMAESDKKRAQLRAEIMRMFFAVFDSQIC